MNENNAWRHGGGTVDEFGNSIPFTEEQDSILNERQKRDAGSADGLQGIEMDKV